MGWFVVLAVLAAFGCICAVWTMFGWLIPGGKGIVTVCLCGPGPTAHWMVRRCCWLREIGLVRGPVLLIDCGITDEEKLELVRLGRDVEFCSPEELPSRLELERNRLG